MPRLARIVLGLLSLALAAVCFTLGACGPVGPVVEESQAIGPDGLPLPPRLRTSNSNSNVVKWNNRGDVWSSINGYPPATMETGPMGLRGQVTGQPRMLTVAINRDGTAFVPPDDPQSPGGAAVTPGEPAAPYMVVTLVDPSDTNFSGFKLDVNRGTLEIATFGAIASRPIESQVPAILATLEANGDIAREQAETVRAAIAAGRDGVVELLALLSKIAAPIPAMPVPTIEVGPPTP